MSRGTGSIRSRFSAYARTLRTIWSVVWSMSCMGESLRPARGVRRRRGPVSAAGSWSPGTRGTPARPARGRWNRPPARRPPPSRRRRSPRPSPCRDRSRSPREAARSSPSTASTASCAARAIVVVHSANTSSSESVPSRVVYAGRAQTANDAIRSVAPLAAATFAAASTSSSAPADPPYAAVARETVRSGRHRKPRGANASVTGELCTSRSVTLPRATWPKEPCEEDPSTITLAWCSSASSRRPTAADRALCRT